MDAKNKVRVLSSYIYEKGTGPHENMGKENKWFKGFVKFLVQTGRSINDIDINFVALPSNRDEDIKIRDVFRQEKVSLVICPGTDAVIRWSNIENKIPVIYFGAHPENNGAELTDRDNVCGVRLNLPLIWSGKNFNLIKKLLPNVEALYFPLNLESEFAFDNVRAIYAAYRSRYSAPWIPHGSHYIGHRSVLFLAESIGCQYFEAPYRGLDEFKAALAAIPSNKKIAIVGFNDTALLPGAIESIAEYANRHQVPLFWVNNLPIISACGVADFSSDFQKVGVKVGELASKILFSGLTAKQLGLHPDQGQRTGINLKRCAELNLNINSELQNEFDIHIS